MKILIVDDERLVRITLESMLMDICKDDIIFQARNAMEMAELLKETKIDVVFLDINMPRQKGLDAMESMKKECPEIDWCILTGYSEFSYAKRALELGAKGYLVKPPDPDELFKFMEEIRKNREEKKNLNRSTFTDMLQKALYLDDFTEIESSKEGYSVFTFYVDSSKPEMRKNIYYILFQKIDQYMKENDNKKSGQYALFFHGSSELCLIFSGNWNLEWKAFLRTHMKDRKETFIVSAFYTYISKIAELRNAIDYQLALAPLRLYCKNYEIVSCSELEKDAMIMQKQYLGVQLEQLLAEYAVGEKHALRQTIANGKNRYREEQDVVVTREVLQYIEILSGVTCQVDTACQLFEKMEEELIVKQQGHETQKNLITQICQYVDQNYMSDVSIDKVGDVFSITPTYLSRMFRKKTGKRYIEFVTQIRMEHARELLLSGKYSVKEISELVGYMSEKHFSRNYKKYYGISPAQDLKMG